MRRAATVGLGALLLLAIPARAGTWDWSAAAVAQAVDACLAGQVDEAAMQAKARALGWPAFEAEMDNGLLISTSFRNGLPAGAGYVMLQTSLREGEGSGVTRRHVACVIGTSNPVRPALTARLAAAFPGFTGQEWWGRLRADGRMETLTADEVANLARTVQPKAPSEQIVHVDMPRPEAGVFASIRFYRYSQ